MSATIAWLGDDGGVVTAGFLGAQAVAATTRISVPSRLLSFPRQIGIDKRHKPIRSDRAAHTAFVKVLRGFRGNNFLFSLAGPDRRSDPVAHRGKHHELLLDLFKPDNRPEMARDDFGLRV